ncbi:hypothetical protein GQR58_016644 [Nymphon striatum]|nr:hypothetical protein GQR58_016644 [Nymphon striatum]
MLHNFKQWAEDASPLVSSACAPAFTMPPSKETAEKRTNKQWRKRGLRTKFSADYLITQDVYLSLFQDDIAYEATQITVDALQTIFKSFIKCTERQLADFLPGGKYGMEPTAELRETMKSCKVTNLVSENEFGDLDFSQFRRRHASLHYHSGIQMVKRNKTISTWLATKVESEQDSLMKIARKKSQALRAKYAAAEQEILSKTKQRLEETFRQKVEKTARTQANKMKIMEEIALHDGPWLSPADVDKVLASKKLMTAKLSCIKAEVRYLKQILGIQDKRLVFGKKNLATLSADLKSVLAVSVSSITSVEVPVLPTTTCTPAATTASTVVKSVWSKEEGTARPTRPPFKKTKARFTNCLQICVDWYVGSCCLRV